MYCVIIFIIRQCAYILTLKLLVLFSSPNLSVTGSCVAVVDYSPVSPDELQLSQGDVVEIQGLLVRGLDVFIGTHMSTGHTGFIHKAHVKPLDTKPL